MSKMQVPQEAKWIEGYRPTPAMERARQQDALLKSKQVFETEPSEAKPVAYFQVDRYTTGSFRGLFIASQLITDDRQGKPLKKPVRKVLAAGVDLVVALASIETALRQKVYR